MATTEVQQGDRWPINAKLLVLAFLIGTVEHIVLEYRLIDVSSIANTLNLSALPAARLRAPKSSGCDERGTTFSPKQRATAQSAWRGYLSYQPPGNGWNNQRQAMELALVLAKMLRRTLIVHPMAPHQLGLQLKRPRPGVHGRKRYRAGYEAYNDMSKEQLTPLSLLLDIKRMQKLLPVVEWTGSHHDFKRSWSNVTWRTVCHSGGHGYWLDQLPAVDDFATRDAFRWQYFSPAGGWQDKCKAEIESISKKKLGPLVRSVFGELSSAREDMVYFAEGTLFACDLRFLEMAAALQAEKWITDYVIPADEIRHKAQLVADRIGPFNAVHVRRGDHQLRHAAPSHWLKRMEESGFLKDNVTSLYVASDEQAKDWFAPFKEKYKLHFAGDFSDILKPDRWPAVARADVLGAHEQAILMMASKFVPSPGSTFSVFVSRSRNEIVRSDGLLTAGTRIKWIQQTTRF